MKGVLLGSTILAVAAGCFGQIIPHQVKQIAAVQVTEFKWLGVLGGVASESNSVNALGEVVGSYQAATGVKYPFVFRNGSMSQVGPGMAGEGWSINALGHIAGQMNFGTLGKQAFISYDGTDATHLGKLPGLASSFGFAINDQDDVVGQSAATGGSPYYAVLFQDGMVIPLPAFSLGREMALDISNSGFITGFSLYVGGPVHAFRILGNTITDIDSANPGGSEGLAVNELGHVAGWRTSLGVQLGYLYDGAMHTINCLPGDTSASAIGLDNLDRVVGYSSHEVGPAIIDSAFLWVSGMAFSLTELSSSHLFAGSRLNDAAHITDNGWICGTGYNSQTGRTEAYRMKVIVNVPKATAGIQL